MIEENLEQKLKRKREELSANSILSRGKHLTVTDRHIFDSKVHDIDYDILVKDGGILVIEAGAILNFEKGKGIYIHQGRWRSGKISIIGEEDKHAVLQAKNGSWDGITLNNSDRDNIIRYAMIIGAKKQDGGGICTKKSRLTIEDTIIEKCEAENRGGGVYNIHSKVRMNNVTLRDNRANHGGGIYNQNSNAYIDNNLITENYAILCGAGICNSHSDVMIRRGNISQNSVKQHGGGVHNHDSIVHIADIRIGENHSIQGGGIFIMGNSKVDVVNAAIEDNNAEYGGGIYSAGTSRINAINTTIQRNHATKSGGGLCNDDKSKASMKSALITNNIAELGGGIYNAGKITVTGTIYDSVLILDNTTIIKNIARGGYGGGIYNFHGEIYDYNNSLQFLLMNHTAPISLVNKNTIENNVPDNIFACDKNE
ncbi:MAG: hypothetical protein ACP5NW_04825 [Candidatus Woesearchaeota archaeon]